MDSLNQGYVNEYSGRLETQLNSAEQELARAIEMGDTKGVIEAQRKITALAIESDRARQAKIQQERYAQQDGRTTAGASSTAHACSATTPSRSKSRGLGTSVTTGLAQMKQ